MLGNAFGQVTGRALQALMDAYWPYTLPLVPTAEANATPLPMRRALLSGLRKRNNSHQSSFRRFFCATSFEPLAVVKISRPASTLTTSR